MNSKIMSDILIIWNNTGAEIISCTIAALRVLKLNTGYKSLVFECVACAIISFIANEVIFYYHYAQQFSLLCGLLVGLLGTKKMVRMIIFLIYRKLR